MSFSEINERQSKRSSGQRSFTYYTSYTYENGREEVNYQFISFERELDHLKITSYQKNLVNQCFSLLDSFHNFNSKPLSSLEQSTFENNFSTIIDQNITVASRLFEKKPRLFLENKSLQNSGQKFLTAYKRTHSKKDYDEYYQSHVANNIQDIISDFIDGRKNVDDKTASSLFKELNRNSPKIADEFVQKNKQKIEKTPALKGLISSTCGFLKMFFILFALSMALVLLRSLYSIVCHDFEFSKKIFQENFNLAFFHLKKSAIIFIERNFNYKFFRRS